MNKSMENYALIVLALFVPHRHVGDLKSTATSDYPHVKKLQEIWRRDQCGEEPEVFSLRRT